MDATVTGATTVTIITVMIKMSLTDTGVLESTVT